LTVSGPRQVNRLRDMTDDVADAALFEDGSAPAFDQHLTSI
jgi:hypothetical protein